MIIVLRLNIKDLAVNSVYSIEVLGRQSSKI